MSIKAMISGGISKLNRKLSELTSDMVWAAVDDMQIDRKSLRIISSVFGASSFLPSYATKFCQLRKFAIESCMVEVSVTSNRSKPQWDEKITQAVLAGLKLL